MISSLFMVFPFARDNYAAGRRRREEDSRKKGPRLVRPPRRSCAAHTPPRARLSTQVNVVPCREQMSSRAMRRAGVLLDFRRTSKEVVRMLATKDGVATVAVRNLNAAKKFYEGTLGLKR